jgi:hypothetical protein
VPQQSLAFARQHQPAAHAVEEPHAELLLEIMDLARQRRLGDAQLQRRLRHRALLDDADEGAQAAQVHAGSLCRSGMK